MISRHVSIWMSVAFTLILLLLLTAGGKPNKGTPADKRLAANKPKPAAQPMPAPKPTPKKGGK